MVNKSLIILLVFVAFPCTKEQRQENDREKLNKQLEEIINFAQSKSCLDASEWTYTSFGHQACGGPVGYIGYSTNIDVELFLKEIENHRNAEQEFNKNGA